MKTEKTIMVEYRYNIGGTEKCAAIVRKDGAAKVQIKLYREKYTDGWYIADDETKTKQPLESWLIEFAAAG